MEKKSSLVQVKIFSGTLQEIETALNAFYLLKGLSLEEARENTKSFGESMFIVFYIERSLAS